MDDPTLDDGDLPPVVVTPRPPVAGNRRRLVVGLVVVGAAIGFLVWRGLGNATVYFRTADEAVAERAALGQRRFRIEGVVKAESIRQDGDALTFTIYGDRGTEVAVVHRGGQPTGLFKDNIPVVLEGRWAQGSTAYASDRVIVKHSETYRSDNPDRVQDYEPARPARPGS